MPENYKPFLGALSLLAVLSIYSFYLREILKGKTKPHAFSWLIWAILGAVAFFGQRSDSAGPGAWLAGIVTVGCVITFLLSLVYGERNIERFDWICLLFAILTIPLWLISQTALWSMVLVSIVDSIGFLPTYRKTWKKPFEETISLYFMSAVANFISILALDKFSWITGLYPVVLVIMNLSFVFMVSLRRRMI